MVSVSSSSPAGFREHGRGGMAAGFQSVYPQVDPNMPCGEYARSEVNAKTEIEHAADGATRQ